ncbi:beta-ketoacyl-ACP synthase III [Aquella oligotrophica]|uniref:Beta-ketoacyl-[acyl-carrier-protein] synthase III n=1 Tax=Aquella oligotrophica TaxID=2067065 RepID=A0A2I7N4T9_9NEIS|nr:beta-ketoacyl-ACP synthase III [Aquella oligotrophica]AUR51472.1 3-oxoacyl-ACP synthase [Aquella oligotrophica]
MKYSKIIATGSYLPAKVLTNNDLAKMVDTNDEWIVERTGIKERRTISENENTSDMAYQAALKAIEMAEIDPSSIDFILVATATPDSVFPSTACILQHKLGIKGGGAYDMQAACSGFIYALATADSYIKAGLAKRILVVGADSLSRIVDYTDRGTCILFGDGAGAVILEASDEVGILGAELKADGSYGSILTSSGHLYNGQIKGSPYIYMDGQAVFKFAVKSLTAIAKELLAKVGMTSNEINWMIPHQANLRIIEATAKMLATPINKVVVTVDRHGNTSAASIPLALDEAVRDGRIKRGDNLLFEGIGAGFTWGAVIARF